MKALWIALVVALAMTANGFTQIPLPQVPESQKQELIGYLTENWMSPEDYVVSKFKDHDIVFIGEWHKVRHDLLLIQNLIPQLYENGIYNLGIEFGNYEDQAKADSLLTAPTYDAATARELIYSHYSIWGYVEYQDLYRSAWDLNHKLPANAPKFRIVNLNYSARWDLLKEEMTGTDWARIWFKGSPDEHMARVVLDEFVKKGQKALIYSGSHHAFTRYHQPHWDDASRTFSGFEMLRMGNIVHDSIPGKVFNIALHYPWHQWQDGSACTYPVGGVIDAIMADLTDSRVGFDAVGSPFGELRDSGAYYSVGYDEFKLRDWCDGYIYQRPFDGYEGCTVDSNFVTLENLHEATTRLDDLEIRKSIVTPADFLKQIRIGADVTRRINEAMARAHPVRSTAPDRFPLPHVSDELTSSLTGYLTENWQSPEHYIIGKFADRDIVFLLGWPWVKHDIELVNRLIPLLYKAGIYDVGMPYASYDLQGRADSLVNADVYDEDLARSLVFAQNTYWAYQEYLDVYRSAWELNRSLPPTAPRCRVVNLGYRPRWDLATVEMTPTDSRRVWYHGTDGEFMARVVLKEFVQRGRKALICPSVRNAFTRFRLPQTDPETRSFAGYSPRGMANIVSDSIPTRVFSINLHWPWIQKDNPGQFSYPLGGVIDAVMREFDAPRVGFDVGGSPFATLVDSTSIFSVGYSPFVLADFCDGYIYQKKIGDYEGCTVDTTFITERNFKEAVQYFPNVAMRQNLRSPAEILGLARSDAAIKSRWAMLR